MIWEELKVCMEGRVTNSEKIISFNICMTVQDPVSKLGRLTFPTALFAYPFYLWQRSPGKKGSHYDPMSDLFAENERHMVSNFRPLLPFKTWAIARFCIQVHNVFKWMRLSFFLRSVLKIWWPWFWQEQDLTPLKCCPSMFFTWMITFPCLHWLLRTVDQYWLLDTDFSYMRTLTFHVWTVDPVSKFSSLLHLPSKTCVWILLSSADKDLQQFYAGHGGIVDICNCCIGPLGNA